MPRLKAKIKYNDGIWIEHYLSSTTNSLEMYNYLAQFKELGCIQDFKLFTVKQVNNKTMEVDIEDIFRRL